MTNRHVKRCSTLFIIREMQIKTTMRLCLTLVRMAVIKETINNNVREDVEKREPSYTVGGNVNWCSQWSFLKKPKIELPCGQAISLLGVYLKKRKPHTRKDEPQCS